MGLIVGLVVLIVVLVGLILLLSKGVALFKKGEVVFKQVQSSIQIAEEGMSSSMPTSALAAGGHVFAPNAATLAALPGELRSLVQQVIAGASTGKLGPDDVAKLRAAAEQYGHHVAVVTNGEIGHELVINPGAPPANAITNIPPPPPGVAVPPAPGVVVPPPSPPAAPPA